MYKDINGNLYTKDGKTLLRYAIGKTSTSFSVPSGVTEIATYAFDGCTNLTSVTLGNDLTTIRRWAFYNCSNLRSVTIGSNVTGIEDRAFHNCTSLTSISFSDTSSWYRTTSEYDFLSKSGGTYTSVSYSSSNDEYFRDTYLMYYWYKI